MAHRRTVPVALLTDADAEVLGANLKLVFKIDETPCFEGLLKAIDEADRQQWSADDREVALKSLRETDNKH